jgi:hypothetical protein
MTFHDLGTITIFVLVQPYFIFLIRGDFARAKDDIYRKHLCGYPRTVRVFLRLQSSMSRFHLESMYRFSCLLSMGLYGQCVKLGWKLY